MTTSKEPKLSIWLTTGQIARHLQMTPETIANWIKRGQLKAGSTPGGHYRIHAAEIVKFCEERGLDIQEEWKQAIIPPTILVIDDDPDIIKSLVPFLQQEGRRVFGCTDIAEAGMMLMKELPDLVILDLHLPGTDGVRIASMLRKQAELSGTRIIVLSGFIDNTIRSTMKNLRIDQYIDKPPNFQELNQTVDELLIKARMDDFKDIEQ